MQDNEAIETEEVEEQEIEEPEPDEGQEPAPVERDPEAEAEARKYGWRPKEDFDRDPAGWVDAKRFLELPSTQKKMVQDELRQVKTETEKRMERLERANKDAMERALAVQKDNYERELSQLRAAQRRAVEEGDTQRYDLLERREQQLLGAPPKMEEPKEEAPQGPDPYIAQYSATPEGSWINDPMLREFGRQAIDAANGAAGHSAQEQVAYAEKKLREYFPHKFEQQKPRPAKVDGGGLAGGRKSGGADKLPPEARKAGKEFVSQGLFKSLDEYAKSYFEEGA